MTGKADTFIIETCRFESGDYIFIEQVDENGVVRLALPPKVANVIASQRDALTKRVRSASARKRMQERMAAGYRPTFAKKKGK